MPKLSIITVNLNNLAGLQKTMQSIFEQTFTDYEYIIIDGGSTDGSKEYIEQYEDRLRYWVSEKDEGIYHAMNKGIGEANGEFCNFLNSGDYFYGADVLNNIFRNDFTEDIIYGDFVDALTCKYYKMPETLNFRFFYKYSINHQASFIKKSLFDHHGKYNEKVQVIADWEFFIKRIFLDNVSIRYLDNPIIYFDFKNSISNKVEMRKLIYQERERVLKENFPLLLNDMEIIENILNSKSYRLIKHITKIKSWFRL